MITAGYRKGLYIATTCVLIQAQAALAQISSSTTTSPTSVNLPAAKPKPSPILQPPPPPKPLSGRVEDTRKEARERNWKGVEEKTQKLIEQNPRDPRVRSLRKLEVLAGMRMEAQEPSMISAKKNPVANALVLNALSASRQAKADVFISDQKLSGQDRAEIMAMQQRRAFEKNASSNRAVRDNVRLQNARQLIAQFPDDSRGYGQLLALAKSQDAAEAKKLIKEIIESNAPEGMKAEARRLDEQRLLEGNPLTLPGVDFSKYQGKVVILYTWSVKRPDVFESVQRWAREGIQCIGINTDADDELARSLVTKVKIPGVQFYDKPGGPITQALKCGALPALYLIDKQGILRDTNGHVGTQAKLQQLSGKKGGK